MSLLDQIATAGGLEVIKGSPEGANFGFRGAPVGWSKDLDRIMSLPRRALDPDNPKAAEAWTKHLRRERTTPCDCDARWGQMGADGKIITGSGCITSLRPQQGWALEEVSDALGMVCSFGVGDGKTGVDILAAMAVPGVKVAVLMIPPSLKRQFFERDYPQWAAHFRVPNLAGFSHFETDGRPVLGVITYSELSQAKNSNMLAESRADLIIADEAHNLSNPGAARTKRFKRAMDEAKKAGKRILYIALSGSIVEDTIKQTAHHAEMALDEKSPIPLEPQVVSEWASALDAGDTRAPMGQLSRLCNKGENVQDAFARRFNDTHGVVRSSGKRIPSSLVVSAKKAPDIPPELMEHIERTRSGQRPDGEEAMEMLTAAMWARQIAAGFYSYWYFPRGEPDETIKDWKLKRKDYHKEARAKLKLSREFMDSPLLLWNAASRWHEGYTFEGKDYKPRTRNGPMPVWESDCWPEWKRVKDLVVHETRYHWLSDYLVCDAAEWAKKHKGIVWVAHRDFGVKVSELTGLPFYDGGKKNPELDEKGDRSIIASAHANSEGKNLQHLWHKNLIANAEASGKRWEQLMGRTHRQGQRAPEVTVEVYLHVPELRRAFDTARARSYFAQTTLRTDRKLCYATIDLTHAVEDPRRPAVQNEWWKDED